MATEARRMTGVEDVTRSPSSNGVAARKNGLGMRIAPKEFHIRNSALTDLWEVKHVKAIYNLCLALCINVVVFSIGYFVMDFDRCIRDVEMLMWNFGRPDVVLLTCSAMFASFFLYLRPLLQRWASRRIPSHRLNFYDYCYMALYLVYMVVLNVIPPWVILGVPVPPASSAIIVFEQIRYVMKAHAFVRENFVRVVAFKVHQDDRSGDDNVKSARVSTWQQLMYFLFAPTLVYRDQYPRTEGNIQWGQVGWHLLQFIFCFLAAFIMIIHFVVEAFSATGLGPAMTAQQLFHVASGAMLVGTLFMFLIFYSFLHCWHNIFAELLHFGDRLFYKDWWNSKTLLQYYRTWNCIVHDWLHSYVYRDIYLLCGQRNKTAPFLAVFLLSAIVHEYIIAMVMHFFLPVLLVLFAGFGVVVAWLTRDMTSSQWNLFLWLSLSMGWGIMLTSYSLEWYCRQNCPPSPGASAWHFLPQMLNCLLTSSSH